MILSKKNCVKIPYNVKVLHILKTNTVFLIGDASKRLVKLSLKISIDQDNMVIYVTNILINKRLVVKKKELNSLQKRTIAMLKQYILEVSVILNAKLKLVGVGFKVFSHELDNKKILLHFKLGFSHPLYIRIPSDMNVFFYKSTNLYIFGSSLKDITQVTARIRSYKTPDPYKGKGILYPNEKIKLKIGKKV